ncbi:MAG: S-layer homology domain-containing protein, partial [Vallitaleaceae bacterium]|nr:S-layer homology domain-containing protein [Vallitaleaceae bacterium]
GDVYGYKQPWSRVETQRLNLGYYSEALGIAMDIKLNPRMEASKTMYYNENEPFPISFGGTYNQRMEREATLSYEILTDHPELTSSQKKANILLTTPNDIEKLPIPEGLDFIEGHWAEEDLKKLYSLEILTEIPHEGMQFEAISRGDFVKALCLAMNIDTSAYEDPDQKSPKIFGDVDYTHPLYKYIMGAYDTKLVQGTGENFSVNQPITRQEAFVIYIRVIGLERLGVSNSPVTPFADDYKIASWAKKEIMAGYKLGIIQGNVANEVQPQKWISKAESAAIINRLIDYLRDEIGRDY